MRIIQTLLVLGVILGITVPKSTALLAELGVIRANVIVICNGAGLQQIALNEDGEPVEVSLDVAPCALTDTVDGSNSTLTAEPYADVIALANYPRPNEVHGLDDVHSTKFARAPPRV
jgi:hypothetical protein